VKNSFGARFRSYTYTALLPCAQKLTGPKNKPQASIHLNSSSAPQIARRDRTNQGLCEENRGTFGEEGNAKARTEYYVTLLAPRARFPIWRTLVGPLERASRDI
jgi:hypothetical protein